MNFSIRPFAQDDLPATMRFCDRARAVDPGIEPFARGLGALASGSRARLDLWRVAPEGDGEVCGIAFAAVREARPLRAPPWLEVYAAVAPGRRRHGIGSALFEAILAEPASLRSRVPEDSAEGRAFLHALGFLDKSVQLSMLWSAKPLERRPSTAFQLRRVKREDAQVLEKLVREAWAGTPDTFSTRAQDVDRFFAEGQTALVAETAQGAVGYLSGAWLGKALAVEEMAVLPGARHSGIGRALLVEAIRDASHAMLTVTESNHAARALYGSLGFATSARRIVCERAAARTRAVPR
ncbi:MAG: GNAT family N-acetyltransferase [Myxococcales bacterium]